MNTVFLYKYNNSKELPEKFSCLPHRKWAAERPKATQLTRHTLAATFTTAEGKARALFNMSTWRFKTQENQKQLAQGLHSSLPANYRNKTDRSGGHKWHNDSAQRHGSTSTLKCSVTTTGIMDLQRQVSSFSVTLWQSTSLLSWLANILQ